MLTATEPARRRQLQQQPKEKKQQDQSRDDVSPARPDGPDAASFVTRPARAYLGAGGFLDLEQESKLALAVERRMRAQQAGAADGAPSNNASVANAPPPRTWPLIAELVSQASHEGKGPRDGAPFSPSFFLVLLLMVRARVCVRVCLQPAGVQLC